MLLLGEREGGVTEEGEGSGGVGASQSPAVLRRVNAPPGTTRTGRTFLFFFFFPPERIFSLRPFSFHPQNFPPHKVILGMWTPRRRSRRWSDAESRQPCSRRHFRSSLEPGRGLMISSYLEHRPSLAELRLFQRNIPVQVQYSLHPHCLPV